MTTVTSKATANTDAANAATNAITGLNPRTIFLFDALTCLAMGILLVAAAGVLSGLLGLPKNFIFMAGLALFPCAALMWFTSRAGTQEHPPAALSWLVIIGNVGWVIASILAIEVWFDATVLGMIFVAAQALVVVTLAVLEYRGLRK
ncbi:hypothetical protein [Undibacterium sp. TJN19]|uniref:hypothetical protein n=1 Tax=Undibacterium sp. TJN19 TaxID=3413055 RepID=UPI003BF09D2C